MTDQIRYESFLRQTFPAFYGTVFEALGDEDEAALVAQRLVLDAYRARLRPGTRSVARAAR